MVEKSHPSGGIVLKDKRIVLLVMIAGFFLAFLAIMDWTVPDGSDFNYAVQVYADDGSELAQFYKERRFYITYQDIPDIVKQAVVAAEDRRFYIHHGFDIRGILRAALRNFEAKSVVQGGSTITQQLAKIIIKDPERNFSRKLREMVVALKLERNYSKDEILGRYLNLAYFGERVYGIEAAARTYFNKSASRLSIAEAALLAGLQKAPSAYSPLRNPEGARKRMATVLKEMLALKFISHEEYEKALSEGMPERTYFQRKYDAPYFVEFMKQQLAEKYGDAVYREGFQILSAIDPSMQTLAEKVLNEGIRQIELRTSPGVQGALLVIDLNTGGIKAMVGGTDFKKTQFNRAVMAIRQPGSAFKPFVYAAALESGISYNDRIFDGPISIRELDTGLWWTPRNSEWEFYGDVSVKTAFALSLNCATVRLAEKIGFVTVRDMAHRCGINAELGVHPSIALGSFEVNLLDLTAAYAAIATGRKFTPLSFISIRDKNGKEIERQELGSEEILSRDVVEKMKVLLRATIDKGIAGRALSINRRVYGKTGTTNDNTDAWFIGFDDRIAVGVWVGRDDHTPLGHLETGSESALPIWTMFMKKVKQR
jgi:penicillin-binding protein 1A